MPSPDYQLTPHYALRALKGDSIISDIDAGFEALASDVEDRMAGFASGTRAARLAATVYDGLVWRETDAGGVFVGDGSAWSPLRLSHTVQSSNYSAVNGDDIAYTGSAFGIVIVLPSPAKGALVRVTNTSGFRVQVDTGSSSIHIRGIGLGPTGSEALLLGQAGASVTVAGDGTGWAIVDGQPDDVWLPAFLGTNIAALSGAFVPAGRIQGDRMLMRGAVQTTAIIPAGQVVVGFPVGTTNQQVLNGLASTGAGRFYITTAGNLTFDVGLPSGTTVYLDGQSYWLY